ncbi:putative protein kinase AGC-RSK-2 family [Lupinus albus]|uniref:non-specific serine/threonine protein kinase n=1 Tax=Lupinus albus TaxID=3870 RepID=A0A6A4Q846_LUPAL|nr:putative protein kinase AGC-RSK-2 family [Lupinus albus]
MLENSGVRDSQLSVETANSTQERSSMSTDIDSICSTSFTRLSFDLFPTPPSPESGSSVSLKPHRSSDFANSATFRRRCSKLTFRDFHLLRRIGQGDIGTVYLCRLRNTLDEEDDVSNCLYAMKVVDKNAVALKKKAQRAETERKILKMLDHPFLPTLYAELDASNFSCIVMEFCSGGDLHSLRHKHPQNRFSLTTARFYAAERTYSIPTVQSSDCFQDAPALPYTRPLINPFSCFSKKAFRSRKVQTVQPDRLFVAEPVNARSCSFVGTHEYVSPEVAAGGSHGNAVDWWSFGVFIYELIYGRTPYAAPSNEATLRNIVKKPLTFPTATPLSALERHARDLISGLLNKEPAQRLGSKRGAAEVKKHSFFKGINMALIRTLTPPEVPGLRRRKTMPLCNAKGFENSSSRLTSTTSFDYYF